VASPKITAEQAIKQKKALQEYNEKRRAEGNAGKQESAKTRLKREQKAALEIISKVNKGIPNTLLQDYVHPTKTELDNAWKIVNAVREYDKQDVALKQAKLALQKAEFEAKVAGDNSPDALKKKAEENDGKPNLSLAYNPAWDKEEFEPEYDYTDLDE
jgi:hypothetical protein